MPQLSWNKQLNCWTKVCSSCKMEYKTFVEGQLEAEKLLKLYFHERTVDTRYPDGFNNQCKQCMNARTSGRGIVVNIHQMLEEQDNKCGCCGEEVSALIPYNAQIDHDHQTGMIRDVVCQRCNIRISRMENSPYWEDVANYLNRWKKNENCPDRP